MNKPYVKQFYKDGNITNPIIGKYESKVFLGTRKVVDELQQTKYVEMFFPNRQERKNLNAKQHSELYALRDQYLKHLKKEKQGIKDYILSLKQNTKSVFGNFLAKFNKAKLAI